MDNSDLLGDKPKFLEDAKRLADDISNKQTFDTVKPLVNFWAAFSPSNEVRETLRPLFKLMMHYAERCWIRRKTQGVSYIVQRLI